MNGNEEVVEFAFDPSYIKIDESAETEQKPQELNLFKDNSLDTNVEKQLQESEENTETNPPSPNDIKDSSSSVFSVVLGQDLVERGVFSSFNKDEVLKIAEEKGDAEAVIAMFEAHARDVDEQIKSTYDEGYKEYLTMVQGGVPKEEAAGIQQLESFSQSIKNIDLKSESEDSVAARKDLLTISLKLSTTFSDDKIKKMVDKMYDDGSDIDEVDEALSTLEANISKEKDRAISEAKKIESDRVAAQQKLISDYKSFVDKTDEYFVGQKVDKATKDKINKLTLDPVKLPNGIVTNGIWAKRNENPVSWDNKVAYLQLIGYFDDKPLSKFEKNAETRSASKLESFLNDNKGRSYSGSLGKSIGKADGKRDLIDL